MALNLALMGRNNLREKVKGVKGAKSLEEKGRIEGGWGKGREMGLQGALQGGERVGVQP